MADPSVPADQPPRQGISFHALREAFAQVLRGRKKTAAAAPTDAPPAEPSPREAAPEPAAVSPPVEAAEPPEAEGIYEDDEACPMSPQSIFEAMLFVGSATSEPLSAAKAAELMRGVEPDDIPDLVGALNRRYLAGGCPYQIVGVGAGYRLALRPEFGSVREKFHGRIREARLSPAAIDVLAIVAYRQPLSADEISRLRAVPSNHLLTQLVRRGLLRLERPEEKGQPAVYHTTHRFLELFDLSSLDDLPQAEDV